MRHRTGRIGEKYTEDSTRVMTAVPSAKNELHPSVYNLLGDRKDDEYKYGIKGTVPIEHGHLLSGPLGIPFPPVKYQPEYYRAGYDVPRGASVQYLEVDPGPMYTMTTQNGNRNHQTNGNIGTLLSITRNLATNDSSSSSSSDDLSSSSSTLSTTNTAKIITLGRTQHPGAEGILSSSVALNNTFPTNLSDVKEIVADSTLHPIAFSRTGPLALGPSGTSMIVLPAGGHRNGTKDINTSLTTHLLQTGHVDERYDLTKSVGQQYKGIPSSNATTNVDIQYIGPNNAIVKGKLPVQNHALLGKTKVDSMENSLAFEGASGGIVGDEGANGLAGNSSTSIHTVIHPLDAFPATRRLVAQEKAAQIEAEKFRKQLVSQHIRRDLLTATMHPHGALGIDSIDNEASYIYGETAARRRLEMERAQTAATIREVKMMGMNNSVVRRGYDILRHDTTGNNNILLAKSARIDPHYLAPADPKAAQKDGIKFVDDKKHVPDPLGRRQGERASTARVLLGENLPSSSRNRTQNLINNDNNGRNFNILTGHQHPSVFQPTIEERKGFWRHSHPAIASLVNPLNR